MLDQTGSPYCFEDAIGPQEVAGIRILNAIGAQVVAGIRTVSAISTQVVAGIRMVECFDPVLSSVGVEGNEGQELTAT